MITTNKTDLTIEKINGADTYKDDTRGDWGRGGGQGTRTGRCFIDQTQ